MHRWAVHIVGAGTMGSGIAHCAAMAELEVTLIDVREDALGRARRAILRDGRLLEMTRRGAGGGDAIDRITMTTDAAALGAASFVIESAPERLAVKEAIFRELDGRCPPGAVLASATSSIPIDLIASWTGRPDRVIGLHFMNPVQWKDAVELVCGKRTSQETREAAESVLQAMGKKGMPAPDGPGFVINRILMRAINEAARLVGEGGCRPRALDRLFRDCLGHRGGPLETADLIGLDNVVDTLRVLADLTGDDGFRPCDALEQMVFAGALGRKTGRGFYEYPES